MTITRAAAATERACRLIAKAAEQLMRSDTNGYGVFVAPADQLRKLNAAMDDLRKAQFIIATTPWPDQADYFRHERGRK